MSRTHPSLPSDRAPCDLPHPQSTKSFWHSEPSPLLTAHRTTRDLPKQADVVVIGSGITGSSVAWHLLTHDGTTKKWCESGLDVVMLEAREACWGATGRNGGHCQPLLFEHPHDPTIANFELANFSALQSLVESRNIDCEFVQQQGVRAIYDSRHLTDVELALHSMQETAPDLAKRMRVVTKKSELKELRIPTAVGAVVTDIAARMWPYKFVAHILQHLLTSQELQGTFNLQTLTPATSLNRTETGAWLVHTPRGPITADKIVLATNAYTSHLMPDFAPLIVPVRGQMSALKPLRSLTTDQNRLRTSFGFMGEGVDDYLIQRPTERGGHLMFGGGRQFGLSIGVTDDSVIDDDTAKYLRGRLVEVLGLPEGKKTSSKEREVNIETKKVSAAPQGVSRGDNRTLEHYYMELRLLELQNAKRLRFTALEKAPSTTQEAEKPTTHWAPMTAFVPTIRQPPYRPPQIAQHRLNTRAVRSKQFADKQPSKLDPKSKELNHHALADGKWERMEMQCRRPTPGYNGVRPDQLDGLDLDVNQDSSAPGPLGASARSTTAAVHDLAKDIVDSYPIIPDRLRHVNQDYSLQLMLLEQQNRKRLLDVSAPESAEEDFRELKAAKKAHDEHGMTQVQQRRPSKLISPQGEMSAVALPERLKYAKENLRGQTVLLEPEEKSRLAGNSTPAALKERQTHDDTALEALKESRTIEAKHEQTSWLGPLAIGAPATATTPPLAKFKSDKVEFQASHEWTGIMGFSRDDLPWVGPVPSPHHDGIYISAGYTGHGMPNAWLCGKSVAVMLEKGAALDRSEDGLRPVTSELTPELQKAGRRAEETGFAVSKVGLPEAYIASARRVKRALEIESVEARDWAEMERARKMREEKPHSGYA